MGRSVGGGGRSSGGGHSHGGVGSHGDSHSHSSSSGQGRQTFNSGPIFPSGYNRIPHYSRSYQPYGGGYGGYSYDYRRNGGIGSVVLTFFVIVACIILITMQSGGFGSSSSIPASTIQREKIETKNAYINDCVQDEIGWINNESKLSKELKAFYQETGCQPYIILRKYDSNMDTDEKRKEWSQNYYDTHFADNQNVLLYTYFCDVNDNGKGNDTLWMGTEASTVFDSEATEIFWAELDHYWNSWNSNDNDGMFREVFNNTATRIMASSNKAADAKKTMFIAIGIIGAGVIVIILIKQRNKRKKEEVQETIDILNSPIEPLGSSKDDDLLNKYK